MRHRTSRVVLPLALALAMGSFGCSLDKSEQSAAVGNSATPSAPAAQEPAQAAETQQVQADAPSKTHRKLVQTAELGVTVSSYEAARNDLESRLKHAGGFIEDATLHHDDVGVSSAQLVIRVPSDKLSSLLEATREAGTVGHETVRTEDVTAQYVDVAARRKAMLKLESRLLDLLGGQTNSVGELLEVERELARVRGEIERMDAQIRAWDDQVALSTLRLNLHVQRPVAAAPSLGEQASRVLDESVYVMGVAGAGIALTAAALVPWVPLILALYGLTRLALWALRRRRPANARPSKPIVAAQPPAGTAGPVLSWQPSSSGARSEASS